MGKNVCQQLFDILKTIACDVGKMLQLLGKRQSVSNQLLYSPDRYTKHSLSILVIAFLLIWII
jgi:hypothetical protein